jgi:non-homologous end joining protein Ku
MHTCDDADLQDLFIHLAKAGVIVKNKGKLGDIVLDEAINYVNTNYKDIIRDKIHTALTTMEIANNDVVMLHIIQQLIDEKTEYFNAGIKSKFKEIIMEKIGTQDGSKITVKGGMKRTCTGGVKRKCKGGKNKLNTKRHKPFRMNKNRKTIKSNKNA